ncbi:MAG: CDP-alcohol phosphatidyltransferase family protein [Calditrichaeota bacterium]|nr:CDP-alcohol phosphatidyltransferase family protein [Calditrichota bacterium]
MFFTLSNILSLSRVFLLAPFIIYYRSYAVSNNKTDYIIAVSIVIFMIISDFLDGFFARKLNQITEWGKILDPLGDKIGAAGVAIALYIYSGLPLWILIVIISRDLLILIGASFLIKKIDHVPSSEWPGKITAFIIALLLLSYIFNFDAAKTFLLILSAISLSYSLLDYILKFIKLSEKQ